MTCSKCGKQTYYLTDDHCLMCKTEYKRKYQRIKKVVFVISARVSGVELPSSYYR